MTLEKHFHHHQLPTTFSRHHGMIMVGQGMSVVGKSNILYTVLGSCVALCLYDATTMIGGMNHCLYPYVDISIRKSNASFYTDVCTEELYEKIINLGANPKRLQAKAFGGGKMFDAASMNVGDRNVDFITNWLNSKQIPLIAQDFSGKYSRKVIFNTGDGSHSCQIMSMET